MPLANRRPHEIEVITHGDHKYHVITEIDPDTAWIDGDRLNGKPIGCSIIGSPSHCKDGTDKSLMLYNISIQTSAALQRGRLPKSMAKDAPRGDNGEPLDVIGHAYDIMCGFSAKET